MPTQIPSLDTAPPFDDYYLFHPRSTSQTRPWQYENTESDQARETGGNMDFGSSVLFIPSAPRNDKLQRTTSQLSIPVSSQSDSAWDQSQQSWPFRTGLTPEPPANFTAHPQPLQNGATPRNSQIASFTHSDGTAPMSPISKSTPQDMDTMKKTAPRATPGSSRKRKIDDSKQPQNKHSKTHNSVPQGLKSLSEVNTLVKFLKDSIQAPEDTNTFHNYSRAEAQQRIIYSAGTVRFHVLRVQSGDLSMVDEVMIATLSEALYNSLLCPPAGAWPGWDAEVREHFNGKEHSQLKAIKDKLEHQTHQLTVSARVKELLHLAKDLHTTGIAMSSITNLGDFDEDMIEDDTLHLLKKPIKVKGGYVLEESLPFISRVHAMIKACSNKHVAKDIVSADFEDLYGLIWAQEGYEKRKYNNGYNNSLKAIRKRRGKAAEEQLKAYNDALTNFNMNEMLPKMPQRDDNEQIRNSSNF